MLNISRLSQFQLIVQQILLVSTVANIYRTMENVYIHVRLEKVNVKQGAIRWEERKQSVKYVNSKHIMFFINLPCAFQH